MGQELLARLELLSASQGLLATYFGNCWLQQLAALLKIPALILLCGIAHKFECLLIQYSCLEALHPTLVHCTLLKFSVVKGCLKLCIQTHLFDWFASWFVTWFICWIAHWSM
jgi:hypothetical protein